MTGFRGKAELRHLEFFPWPPQDLRALTLAQDVIWVGGGNTANMLAIWRVHGFDRILREAWEQSVVLAGGSAGMICWFEAGVTDSFGPQLEGMRDGLGFLPGSACPHWDDEENRRPVYRRLIDEEGFPSGYAADSGVGLHFVGTDLVEVLSDRPEGDRLPRRAGQRDAARAARPALAGGPDPLDGVAALEPERAEQVGGDPSNLADEVCCGEGRVDLQRPRRERRRLDRSVDRSGAVPLLQGRLDETDRLRQEPDRRRNLSGLVRIELDRPG